MSEPHRMRLRNGIRTVNVLTGDTEPTYGEYVLASDYDALRAERDELLETQRKFGSMMHEQMDKLDEAVALLTEIAGHRAAVQFFAPHLAGVVAVLARIQAFLDKVKP